MKFHDCHFLQLNIFPGLFGCCHPSLHSWEVFCLHIESVTATRWDWGVTTPVTSNMMLRFSARNGVQVMEEFCLFVFLSIVLGFSSWTVRRASEVDEDLILPFLLLPSPNPSPVQVLRKLPSSMQYPLQLLPTPWPERVVLGAWSAAPAMTPQTWRTARPGSGAFVETTSNTAPSSWKNSWVRRGLAKTCGPRWTSITPMLASRWGAAAAAGLERSQDSMQVF